MIKLHQIIIVVIIMFRTKWSYVITAWASLYFNMSAENIRSIASFNDAMDNMLLRI